MEKVPNLQERPVSMSGQSVSGELGVESLTRVEGAAFPDGLLQLDYRSPVDGLADWAMLLPPPSGSTWLVCIHGHGARGNQLYLRNDIRKAWLPSFLLRGYGLLTPTLRGNAWMSPAAVADMDALIDYLRREWGATRFVFASGSMGGTSNLIYANLRPANVQAVAAMGAIADLAAYYEFCRQGASRLTILGEIADSLEEHYGGSPTQQPELYRRHSPLYHCEALLRMPVFLAHGTADLLMPVAQSRRLTGALAEHECFCYHEIADGGHDAPLHMDPCEFIAEKMSNA